MTSLDMVADDWSAAEAAAHRAGVQLSESEDMTELRAVSALLESVWGRSHEGVPVHSEVLRGLAHAGGAMTLAHDADGVVVGTALLAVATPPGSTYSMIAAVAPGTADRGIGRAVKLRQRAWALGQGHESIRWTFDPLVGRNARVNLVTLGAEAVEYERSFYGQMRDDLNGEDESDRLVVEWRLPAPRAVRAAPGSSTHRDGPGEDSAVLREGPDGEPMLRHDGKDRWCRVPLDVVALRRGRPQDASQWRRHPRGLHRGLR